MAFEIGARQDQRGVIDAFLSWAEELKKSGLYPYGLEEQILTIERLVQDLDSQSLSGAVTNRLSFWLSLQQRGANEELLRGLQVQLQEMINALVTHGSRGDVDSAVREVNNIPPLPPADWSPHSQLSDLSQQFVDRCTTVLSDAAVNFGAITAAITGVANSLTMFAGGSFITHAASNLIQWTGTSVRTGAEVRKKTLVAQRAELEHVEKFATDEWTVEVRFLGDDRSAAEVLEALWMIVQGFQAIPSVSVSIEELRKGSIIARLKVKFAAAWRRDEVQEVLERARRGIEAQYVDKPAAEATRDEAEAVKLKEEAENLRRERELRSSDADVTKHQSLAMELRELEVRDKAADIVRKELENRMMMLTLAEKASDLIQRGIIVADPVEISINNYPFLALRRGVPEPGVDLKQVPSTPTVQPPETPGTSA